MESLYRKYRPQTFDDVVGQQHVVTTLKRAVLEGRTSHAYLFCGPRGTGKTTMARLLAKALLCEQGAGRLPDGTCEECRLIAAGEHPDVYELDAASNTGVDNVREEIINRVGYAPVRGAFKIYIIDEVHMLTTAAFNALLKTLEEPPSHIVFILCTTDPQKVLDTILSRVQRFDFHAIGNEELLGRLAYVCRCEGFTYEDRALELIARHARGGMRDALTKLEQLATATGGKVSTAAAEALLGEVSASTLADVSAALARRDVSALFSAVAALTDEGRDLLQFVHELAARLRDAYVVCAVGNLPGVVDATGDDLRRLTEEAAAYGSPERLSRALAILADASTEMRVATNQRLVLELAFTRLSHPESDVTLDALAERVADLEARLAQLENAPRTVVMAPSATASAPTLATEGRVEPETRGGATETSPVQSASRAVEVTQTSRPPQTSRPVQAAPAAPRASQPMPREQAAPQGGAALSTAPVRERQVIASSEHPVSNPPATSAAAPGAVTDPSDLQRRWKRVCDDLLASAPARGSLLMQSTIVSDDGTRITVSLPKGSGFACKMLERPDVREAINPFVLRNFGTRTVSYVEGQPPTAQVASPERRQRDVLTASRDEAPVVASPQQAATVAPAQPMQAATPPAQSTRTAAAKVEGQVTSAPVHPERFATQGAPSQEVPQRRAQANRGPVATTAAPTSHLAPWDDLPRDEVPADDEVPYSDADAAYFGEEEWDLGYDASLVASLMTPPRQRSEAASAPVQQNEPLPSPRAGHPGADREAAEPPTPPEATGQAERVVERSVPAGGGIPASGNTEPVVASSPAAAANAASGPKQEEPLRQAPPALTTAPSVRSQDAIDQESVMSMLTEIFGPGVGYMGTEPAVSQLEDESAFIDEPIDDADFEE